MSQTPVRPRILVVDDEPAILKLVARILDGAGYQAETAPDAKSALARIASEPFDALVTDAMMPEMSGYELVRTLRQDPRLSRFPIVMLTRKRDRGEVREAVLAGVTDYVMKPVDDQLLLEKIRLSVQRRSSSEHIHSLSLHGETSEAALRIPARVTELGESGLSLSAPVPLTSPVPTHFAGRIFEDLGISPALRLASSHQNPDAPTLNRFTIRLTLSGLSDTELARLRRARYLYRFWHLEGGSPRPPHLLAVDDEPSILKLVRHQLERAGYSVDTATSGADALLKLQECHYDLLITDALMPEMDGYELLRAIRSDSLLAQVPAILLTRRRNAEDVRKALEAGISDYLVKPVDAKALVEKTASCLARFPIQPNPALLPAPGAAGGPLEEASFHIPVRIASISESGLKLTLPVEVDADTPIDLRGRMFDEIGIEEPFLRLLECRGATGSDSGYEADLAFVGLGEQSLTKLRAWIQRHDIQRRK